MVTEVLRKVRESAVLKSSLIFAGGVALGAYLSKKPPVNERIADRSPSPEVLVPSYYHQIRDMIEVDRDATRIFAALERPLNRTLTVELQKLKVGAGIISMLNIAMAEPGYHLLECKIFETDSGGLEYKLHRLEERTPLQNLSELQQQYISETLKGAYTALCEAERAGSLDIQVRGIPAVCD